MQTNTINEIRRLVDEIELEAHLARLEARDRWNELKPKVRELERTIETAGKTAVRTIANKVSELAGELKKLRDEISDELHGAPSVWQ